MSRANFDIGHNIYTSIFHMHITYRKSFSNVATYKTLTFDLHLIVNNRLIKTLYLEHVFTVVPTKNDCDVILCLQLLSKTLTCTLHLSIRESIDHSCINPILWIGLIHK